MSGGGSFPKQLNIHLKIFFSCALDDSLKKTTLWIIFLQLISSLLKNAIENRAGISSLNDAHLIWNSISLVVSPLFSKIMAIFVSFIKSCKRKSLEQLLEFLHFHEYFAQGLTRKFDSFLSTNKNDILIDMIYPLWKIMKNREKTSGGNPVGYIQIIHHRTFEKKEFCPKKTDQETILHLTNPFTNFHKQSSQTSHKINHEIIKDESDFLR